MKQEKGKKLTLKITQEKEFEGDLAVYVFDRTGKLEERAEVKKGEAHLKTSQKSILRSEVYIAPIPPGEQQEATLKYMEHIGAYRPVLKPGLQEDIRKEIYLPGDLIDRWWPCFCRVKGQVVKTPGGYPICDARVHICEVDRIWRFIDRLPDLDLARIRDDLLDIINRPPIVFPPQPPGPIPRPQPDPVPFREGAGLSGNLPSELDSEKYVHQARLAKAAEELPESAMKALQSDSPQAIRSILIDYEDLTRYFLCLRPWWWRYRCDEIRVLQTDSHGRFDTFLIHSCSGDQPDLYFWVEYKIEGSWETVYHPPIPCNTYWNYDCDTEVTIKVSDERVPACDPEPDLSGLQVAVMSIGNNVSISELQGAGAPAAQEGLTTSGRPFGGNLEPHVWFSRENLIDAGITKYQWSWRRLTDPDGTTPNVGSWHALTRTVGRHYAVVDPATSELSFPFETLGPDASNLFSIKPVDPPAGGIEWRVLDAREDTASGFFETKKLPHGLPGSPTECEQAELTAGKYELRLELYNDDGSKVDDWEAKGIELKTASDPAPFGTGTVHTVDAADYHRIKNSSGKTTAFRMVVRVDNNCCHAQIHPVSGTGLTVDANCGFVEYDPGAVAHISFDAVHPHNFATFNFNTVRGTGRHVGPASTNGRVGSSIGTSFTLTTPFTYGKHIPVDTLLTVNTPSGSTPCDRAAFAEHLYVNALATDGWHQLNELDASDMAAYALAKPCDCNGQSEN